MSVQKIGIAMLAVSAAVAGCKKREMPPGPQVPAATAATQPVQQIEWFNGGLDAAFVKASAESKPVFLYWGAVWWTTKRKKTRNASRTACRKPPNCAPRMRGSSVRV